MNIVSGFSTLGAHILLQRGTTYRSRLLGQPGPVLLGLASISRNGGFRADNLQSYGGESPSKLLLKPGDIYVSLKDVTQSGDLLGAVAQVPDSISMGRVTQDTVKLIPKPGAASLRYLYWLLRTPHYRNYCRERGIGTTNLALNRKDFLSYPVPAESPARVEMVRVLDQFEELIEKKRKMNQTLEAMAQALFKSWFVEFEPIIAKRDGRIPFGMSADTAKRFPAHFQDSEFGPVPEGWNWSTAGAVIDFNPMRILHRGTLAPHLEMKAIPTASYAPDHVVQRPAGSGAKFANGDTLLARITPCLENGKTAFIDCLEKGQVGWGSTEFIVLAPLPPLPTVFGYLLARHEDFREHAIRSMTGSSGRQRVAIDDLKRYLIPVAPNSIYDAFETLVDPWFALAKSNLAEIRRLAQLRDYLLPRLVTGQVGTKNAERLVTNRI